MKQRPILFKPDMIRAILSRQKVQTRRIAKQFDTAIIKVVHKNGGGNFVGWSDVNVTEKWTKQAYPNGEGVKCPYGKVGDRLWVKESVGLSGNRVFYRSDHSEAEGSGLRGMYDFNWLSPLFMPKKAARIWLEITDVRCERLDDISERDCIKEGIGRELIQFPINGNEPITWYYNYWQKEHSTLSPHISYQSLWETINGVDSWSENPFVWVVEFKLISN